MTSSRAPSPPAPLSHCGGRGGTSGNGVVAQEKHLDGFGMSRESGVEDVVRAGVVAAVSRSGTHTMCKPNEGSITLLAGLGVEGDAHQGETVKHRSRVARDPSQPNLRQVHLIHAELHDELRDAGFAIAPGQMGENVTTRGVDLLGLPVGARLQLGSTAVVEITGLRNPCAQLDGIQPGLMKATLDRDAEGNLIRKAGVMGIVLAGGEVRPGDVIQAELPPQPHHALGPV
jgi:MOSC domain-containing protein YiiM